MSVEFLDFYADWCGPCIIMDPIIGELEKEFSGQMKIKKIDVDQNEQEAAKYGVMSIPTYILLKNGKEADRIIGAVPKQVLKNKVEAALHAS